MRALAIETSGRIGSVALVDGGIVLGEDQFAHGLQHAAHLVPMIDRLIKSNQWSPSDIDEVYVSVGPGSFTGLRIGITLAKTFAFGGRAKLVAVPSVRVLVENAPAESKHVIIVLDAKRDQIFTARFERSASDWIEREAARLDDLPSMLLRSPKPVHLIGEGIPYHEKFLVKGDPSVVVTPQECWRARASAVAKIGAELSREGRFADPYLLQPIYIRRPEAEEKLEAQKK